MAQFLSGHLSIRFSNGVESMDALKRALIEKVGQENGWENAGSEPNTVILTSARHRASICVSMVGNGWGIETPAKLIHQELWRSFPAATQNGSMFIAQNTDELAQLLRRTAELAQSLPHQAARTYTLRVQEAIKSSELTTEVERLTKQRIGQETFREALMDYWGGACAVTGIALPQILRASHTKPWANCQTDEERLDVFNGFLFTANLDALFDRGLITFEYTGQLCLSSKLNYPTRAALNLNCNLSLRWIAPQHESYLNWHRHNIFFGISN